LVGVLGGINTIPLLQKKAFSIALENITEVSFYTENVNASNIILTLGLDLNAIIEQDGAGLALSIPEGQELTYKTQYVNGTLIHGIGVETGVRTLNLRWIAQNGDKYIAYTQNNIQDLPLGTIIKWY
jgi:hypothetical protein